MGFKTYGIHTRLHYIIKYSGGMNRTFCTETLIKEYNLPWNVAYKFSGYSNCWKTIRENGIEKGLELLEEIEEQNRKEAEQSRRSLGMMMSCLGDLGSNCRNGFI